MTDQQEYGRPLDGSTETGQLHGSAQRPAPTTTAPHSLILRSVGFQWMEHPHRIHGIDVGPGFASGAQVRGGPWTTGDRATDVAVSYVSWAPVSDVRQLIECPRQRAAGPGLAEATWPLISNEEREPNRAVFAVSGFSMHSTSHAAGFNLCELAFGVRPADAETTEQSPGAIAEAFVRVGAAKVPERRERFLHIEFEANISVVELGDAFSNQSLNCLHRTRAGVLPKHSPAHLPCDVQPIGLASIGFRVANSQAWTGRYLRSWKTTVQPDGVEFLVSNRGEVTRRTNWDLAATVIHERPHGSMRAAESSETAPGTGRT